MCVYHRSILPNNVLLAKFFISTLPVFKIEESFWQWAKEGGGNWSPIIDYSVCEWMVQFTSKQLKSILNDL
jgi:hypothetical protein